MPIDVPNQLAYLTPVFEQLAQFAPEELGDDNPLAMDVVEAAVRSRVAGMTADQAAQMIQDDADALQQWTDSSDAPQTAHYVHGALFGMRMFADFDELTS